MHLSLHPDFQVRQFTIGREGAPLIVIDNFLADAEQLVDIAAGKLFGPTTRLYPGIRAPAPLLYQNFFSANIQSVLAQAFGRPARPLQFTMCHFSLITTPTDKLHILQRIPHVDSLGMNELAAIHYLFKADHGGTAFYRHRKTGFEFVDQSRKDTYFRSLESENDGPNMPAPEYINGDTPLFEQIEKQDGVFNRVLIYRRNSLHSGCIGRDFIPDPNPRTGRLSINSFIE
ncbi:MAG TPA: DUF6445 family protein [Steroidobacteraceae bacterium]|jgi:hypothetical protein|nr:DUF6445 family protein [Steroidobacteraceae bacterium]